MSFRHFNNVETLCYFAFVYFPTCPTTYYIRTETWQFSPRFIPRSPQASRPPGIRTRQKNSYYFILLCVIPFAACLLMKACQILRQNSWLQGAQNTVFWITGSDIPGTLLGSIHAFKESRRIKTTHSYSCVMSFFSPIISSNSYFDKYCEFCQPDVHRSIMSSNVELCWLKLVTIMR